MGCVIDASAALAWCFQDEQTAEGFALLQQVQAEFALVPAVWALEVTNVLAEAERKRRLNSAEVNEYLALFAGLDIHFDETSPARAFTAIFNLVRNEGLSSYDASYLELAMRSGLPLATRDRALANAARRNGVTVIRC